MKPLTEGWQARMESATAEILEGIDKLITLQEEIANAGEQPKSDRQIARRMIEKEFTHDGVIDFSEMKQYRLDEWYEMLQREGKQ